ncbi:MAG: hypothetical protein ABI811_04675 [Acidobacteriota bacterium]
MRQECPECRTVTGGNAGYCGSCGYVFKIDAVRRVAGKSKPKTHYATAATIGVAVAVVHYVLFR